MKLILILTHPPFYLFFFFLGSIYEPLKSINLPKPEGESLWDKLDHYYRIGKLIILIIVPTMEDFQCNLLKYIEL